MVKPKPKKTTKRAEKTERSPIANVLLTLTLIPSISGVILIILWALEISPWGDLENQLVVATLMILFGFAASNAVQRKWTSAAGWFLLMIGDALLLSILDVRLQILAALLALMGLILLIYELVIRLQQQARQ